jgi:hypothetical protein
MGLLRPLAGLFFGLTIRNIYIFLGPNPMVNQSILIRYAAV